MKQNRNNRRTNEQPTIAPGMDNDDALEERATPEDVRQGESTLVTRLSADRTPQD